jgi:hypothetical protein
MICAVCCGTKRLTEIPCPSDCTYLISARDHPPAMVVRQQQRDLTLLLRLMQDLTEPQRELLLLIGAFVLEYRPSELQTLIDDDVLDASRALAATLETAARGVIYQHPAASATGERLGAAINAFVTDASKRTPIPERDCAVVLRRIEAAVPELRASEPGSPRALLDLFARVIRRPAAADAKTPEAPSGLIVP